MFKVVFDCDVFFYDDDEMEIDYEEIGIYDTREEAISAIKADIALYDTEILHDYLDEYDAILVIRRYKPGERGRIESEYGRYCIYDEDEEYEP